MVLLSAHSSAVLESCSLVLHREQQVKQSTLGDQDTGEQNHSDDSSVLPVGTQKSGHDAQIGQYGQADLGIHERSSVWISKPVSLAVDDHERAHDDPDQEQLNGPEQKQRGAVMKEYGHHEHDECCYREQGPILIGLHVRLSLGNIDSMMDSP